LDHFEKWLGICKLPKNTNNSHNAMRPVMNEQDICKEVKDSVESFDDYEPKAKKQRQCLGKQSEILLKVALNTINLNLDILCKKNKPNI
jgi:hypothetical protein